MKSSNISSLSSQIGLPAGTLIHTETGLKPIQQVRAGSRLFAQAEPGADYVAEHGLHQVLMVKAVADAPLWLLRYRWQEQLASGAAITHTDHVLTTAAHPFWTEEQQWIAACYLNRDHSLQLVNGQAAQIVSVARVVQTDQPGLAWSENPDKPGIANGHWLRQNDQGGLDLLTEHPDCQAQVLADQAWLSVVYNFEVEGFHTYYIAQAGVWVHNSNDCMKTQRENQQMILNRTEVLAEHQCFTSETKVQGRLGWLKIEYIHPGDVVLSRCEKTGQLAYKKVISRIEAQKDDVYFVDYRSSNGEEEYIEVTSEHPFWVKQKGWVAVKDLQEGDILISCNFEGERDAHYAPDFVIPPSLRPELWEATVTGVTEDIGRMRTVYNFEVEDFHTYFAGYHGIWVQSSGS